jgi:hypothetical protein
MIDGSLGGLFPLAPTFNRPRPRPRPPPCLPSFPLPPKLPLPMHPQARLQAAQSELQFLRQQVAGAHRPAGDAGDAEATIARLRRELAEAEAASATHQARVTDLTHQLESRGRAEGELSRLRAVGAHTFTSPTHPPPPCPAPSIFSCPLGHSSGVLVA